MLHLGSLEMVRKSLISYFQLKFGDHSGERLCTIEHASSACQDHADGVQAMSCVTNCWIALGKKEHPQRFKRVSLLPFCVGFGNLILAWKNSDLASCGSSHSGNPLHYAHAEAVSGSGVFILQAVYHVDANLRTSASILPHLPRAAAKKGSLNGQIWAQSRTCPQTATASLIIASHRQIHLTHVVSSICHLPVSQADTIAFNAQSALKRHFNLPNGCPQPWQSDAPSLWSLSNLGGSAIRRDLEDIIGCWAGLAEGQIGDWGHYGWGQPQSIWVNALMLLKPTLILMGIMAEYAMIPVDGLSWILRWIGYPRIHLDRPFWSYLGSLQGGNPWSGSPFMELCVGKLEY